MDCYIRHWCQPFCWWRGWWWGFWWPEVGHRHCPLFQAERDFLWQEVLPCRAQGYARSVSISFFSALTNNHSQTTERLSRTTWRLPARVMMRFRSLRPSLLLSARRSLTTFRSTNSSLASPSTLRECKLCLDFKQIVMYLMLIYYS